MLFVVNILHTYFYTHTQFYIHTDVYITKIFPQSINKDGKKHIRKPIDLSELDDIGHGVVVQEEPRPVPLHQSQNINSIVGRDKAGAQREKTRGHPFSSSLKQNGAGPPRGGET